MMVLSWANDLSKVDKYVFPADKYKEVGGFYDIDTEWGHYVVYDVLAWAKVDMYEGE